MRPVAPGKGDMCSAVQASPAVVLESNERAAHSQIQTRYILNVLIWFASGDTRYESPFATLICYFNPNLIIMIRFKVR